MQNNSNVLSPTGTNLTTVDQTVKFDKEVYDIIASINPIYRNSIINMAVKQFMNTDIFGYYFSNAAINDLLNKDMTNVKAPSINQVHTSAQNVYQEQHNQQNQHNQQKPQAEVPPIASWDNF